MKLRSSSTVQGDPSSTETKEAVHHTKFTSLPKKVETKPVCTGEHGCEANLGILAGHIEKGTGGESGDSQIENYLLSLSPNMNATQGTGNNVAQNQRPRETFRPHNKYVILGLQVSSAVLVTLYFILPTIIRICPWIMSEVAFLNRVRWPPFVNLSRPEELGLNYTRSFTLDSAEDVTIGAWHTLPQALQDTGVLDDDFVKLLANGSPLLLYFHGNAGTRGGWHRVQLYKVLARAGFHVISIDYRGYGDSSGSPSEPGLCDDGLAMYQWLRQQAPDSQIYIWGHSMGTGVATRVARSICEKDQRLDGLFLEAPFNNFLEAASQHPFSQPFKILPWFTWGFIEAMKSNNIKFTSDVNIAKVTVPTLILHAKDDGIVPYSLGQKLYQTAMTTKLQGRVQMITFDGNHDYGHKHIHKSPHLITIVRDFIDGKEMTVYY